MRIEDVIVREVGVLSFVEARVIEPMLELFDAELLNVLVAFYSVEPVLVAALCDEQLDPSGALLGRVRDRSQQIADARAAVGVSGEPTP